MADVQAWPDIPSLSSSYPSNPHPTAISVDSWSQAEQTTKEVLRLIQPTLVSEERRKTVIDYVQKLIRGSLGTVVIFPFGSVPLKTYLPDGDIDLTAFVGPNSEDVLAGEVRSILEIEEQNEDAEFEVKDVQYIHAEVKLVKCVVQNIVVDISFNQIGGLCTFCFLEQVDRLIGKDHLFKRSIILIKAWCYYESRILGAHHGLISTYALETLVLYIFHLFHSSLGGPLAVLYRFLDYFSKFDWDNYCISLHGPISVSSLPELVAEAPETDGGDLLLSKEFLKSCVEMFSVTPRGSENNSRVFTQKHLNIVDPLKVTNNLGRSVSKGNFYRIRSAFTYGARKLGRVLLLPGENLAGELNMFFMSTLERHGSGERPDVEDALPSCPDSTAFDLNRLCSVSSELEVVKGGEDKLISTIDSHEALCKEINEIRISGLEKQHGSRMQLGRHPSNDQLVADCLQKSTITESNGPLEGNVVSGSRLAGDARDLATSRSSSSGTMNETFEASTPSSETGASSSGKAYYAPHLFFGPQNGNLILDRREPTNAATVEKASSSRPLDADQEINLVFQPEPHETESSSHTTSWLSSKGENSASASSNDVSKTSSSNAFLSDNSADCSPERNQGNGSSGSPKFFNLSDLTGNYELHFKSLLYAQWCQEYMMPGLVLPISQSSPSQFRNNNSWDDSHWRNTYSRSNANGMLPGPSFSVPGCYPMNPPSISGSYGMEDAPKTRGTGTYFPNMSYHSYKERLSPGRGRNAVSTSQLPRTRSNGRAVTSPDTNSPEKISHETPPQEQLPILNGNGRGKQVSCETPPPREQFPVLNGNGRGKQISHEAPPQEQFPVSNGNGHRKQVSHETLPQEQVSVLNGNGHGKPVSHEASPQEQFPVSNGNGRGKQVSHETPPREQFPVLNGNGRGKQISHEAPPQEQFPVSNGNGHRKQVSHETLPQEQVSVLNGNGHGKPVSHEASPQEQFPVSNGNGRGKQVSHEAPPQEQFPVSNGNGHGKLGLLDIPHTSGPALRGFSISNSFLFPRASRLESGSVSPVPLGAPSPKLGRRLDSVTPHTEGSEPIIPASTVRKLGMSANHERVTKSYQLKDEADFPPLLLSTVVEGAYTNKDETSLRYRTKKY